ncbi:MAG: nucleotide exchange factor GrpE [Euryarchaeota archaeon]|nr:nucleotide exchange factor GrpE [Euryarchaeota archaeon]MBU4547690.1 nucleotide exchange factor GrpE [Euryarchaeota archaeon]MBU4607604.1 nucleotide exchange factor GrpE [Euryarchaeota archaeon]MBV1755417.1 nucleotide exchange factor GrpE [Methanobacterium sp.]
MWDDKDLKKLKAELKEKESIIKEKDTTLQEAAGQIEEMEKKLKKNEEELNKVEEKSSEYYSQLQRMQADFDNYKKHSAKQHAHTIDYATEGLILKILDVYQDFERALESCETEKDLREGLELIYGKLRTTLEKEGLKEIPTQGEKFDPFKHEALMAEDHTEFENGMVIDELSKGYTLKDKVIKYSMVKVCKKNDS